MLAWAKNNRLLILNMVHQHTKYEICPSFSSWDILFTMFSQIDPCWPNMTSTKNNRLLVLYVVHVRTKYENYPSFPSWDIVFTRFSQFDPCWPPNDLWPPQKTIDFLYSMWCTYILNMRFVQGSLLEISCLQGFHNWPLLTPYDLHQKQ